MNSATLFSESLSMALLPGLLKSLTQLQYEHRSPYSEECVREDIFDWSYFIELPSTNCAPEIQNK